MTVTLVHSYVTPAGEPMLGVLAKRAYDIRPGRRATVSTDAPTIERDPRYEQDPSRDEPVLIGDSDLAAFVKPLTDVCLRAKAHAPNGAVRSLETGVEIGPIHRRIHVWGERRIAVGADGELSFTPAEGFATMALGWDRAYGGRDRGAELRLFGEDFEPLRLDGSGPSRRAGDSEEACHGSLGYPRNACGRGFFIDLERERLQDELVPNLEDPDDPIRPGRLLARDALDWIDRPASAGYGPIDIFTFPRCMFFLLHPDWSPPERPIREVTLGALHTDDLRDRGLTEPVDPRIANSAAPGLAICRLEGGEHVQLWHLHPTQARLEFDLPGERPRLWLEPPNAGKRELEAKLQTVWLEPEEDRLTLTWTGSLPVAARFPPEMCDVMPHGAEWNQ